MTRPIGEGDAFVTFHADTEPVYGEAERGINRAAERLEDDDLKGIGHDFGETISKSMGDEFEKQGPGLAKSIERGLGRQKIKTKVKVGVDRDRNLISRTVDDIVEDVEQAFNKASSPGGPFNRIGTGIADAIGAGFNVSGRSSLIVLLIPVIGAIVGLVAGALQAINGLIAALATLPALIGAIAFQAGALFFAFKGVGTAIGEAFAAKNAKELNEALKNLTPSARQFVRELLPLRDMFNAINKLAQESFFKSLGSVIPELQKNLGTTFAFGIRDLADSLGRLFRDMALFFASETFVTFVKNVIPSTVDFLERFGPSFITFLEGLTRLSIGILPFLEALGHMLSGTLFQLGEFFKRVTDRGELEKWLTSMQKTLELVLELFGGLVEFVTVFLAQLDEAGGKEVLQTLIDAFEQLTFFLSTPVGKQALEGLINFGIISIKVLTGIIETLLILFAIGETVGEALRAFFIFVGEGIAKLWNLIVNYFTRGSDSVKNSLGTIVAEAKALPGKILAAVGNLGSLLFNAGVNLIQGLINGIKSKIPSLTDVMGFIAQKVRDHWPFSPAKVGPLSGSGDPMIAGQKTIERFAEGMHMEIPTIREASSEAVNNIVFGRGAISVEFRGAVPTPEQARQTGMSVGTGINGQLAARNVQLAVRTL